MNTDRIEKQVVLKATRERVWQAISDARQFGYWFGAAFDGLFVAGARISGRIVMTQVDAEVAKLQQPHENKRMEWHVERIEPMRRIAFRWHPFAIDPDTDYSQEPMTLIEFVLADHAEGTQLTITESGFDRIPLARRAEAFAANDGGWTHQIELIRKYLALQT